MSNFYAALEIGTTRTVLAIGEPTPNGRLKMTCHAEIPSTGVRKSRILDISQATQSVRSVLAAIQKEQDERGSRITIGNAFLVVSGHHIETSPAVGTASIQGTQVSNADIEAVMRSARSIDIPKGRELLDIVDQDYVIDNMGSITAPKGMSGRMLRLNSLQIHADAARIQDARTAADGAHLEIREPLFAMTCAAEAVLEDHERKNGALVLDLGGGSTGYAVYADGFLAACGVVGVGGDHVTSDIAHAFQTTNAQAESLKIDEASAMIRPEDAAAARIKIPGENPLFENRTISRRALDTVVNERLRELLLIIADRLDQLGILQRLHAGVILTGHGAALRDIDALVQQTLGLNVRIGRPTQIDGLEDVPFPASFAAISGALLYAHHNYEEKSIIGDLIGRFFK